MGTTGAARRGRGCSEEERHAYVSERQVFDLDGNGRLVLVRKQNEQTSRNRLTLQSEVSVTRPMNG